ncbi:MAG: GNAT family N-acetyltransferase, partial [Methyloligellaceae bacterium]
MTKDTSASDTGAIASSGNFDPQPVLHGDLLDVRPLHREDYAALYEAARDPRIWEQHPARNRHEPDAFRSYFDDAIRCGGALAVLKAGTQEIIGTTRYHGYDPDRSEVEIGWTSLTRACWGGLYNKELKDLTLRHVIQ